MPDLPNIESAGEPREPKLSTADLAGVAGPPSGIAEPRSFEDGRGGVKAGGDGSGQVAEPLFPPAEADDLRTRWTDIQTSFVDEPRRTVEDADGLVAEAIKLLAEMFARERAELEGQWDRGGDVSTEDLRQALQRYRSFFTRLLSV